MSFLDQLLDDIDSMRDGRFKEKFQPKQAPKRPMPQVEAQDIQAAKRRKVETANKKIVTKPITKHNDKENTKNKKPINIDDEAIMNEMAIMFGKDPNTLIEEDDNGVVLGDEPYIDSVEKCKVAVRELSRHDIIAVDCEWSAPNDSIRSQELCLIQISDPNKKPYLFDVLVCKEIIGGGLKNLLENPKIIKIFHDCRWDSDVLWHQAGIKLCNVYDTQIGYAIYRRQQEATVPLPVALNTVLKRFDLLNASKQEAREGMINSETYWKTRPLTPVMMKYAREDVIYLHHVYRQLAAIFSKSSNNLALKYSSAYLTQRREQTLEFLIKQRDEEKANLKDGERPIPKYGIEEWDKECKLSVERQKRRSLKR